MAIGKIFQVGKFTFVPNPDANLSRGGVQPCVLEVVVEPGVLKIILQGDQMHAHILAALVGSWPVVAHADHHVEVVAAVTLANRLKLTECCRKKRRV